MYQKTINLIFSLFTNFFLLIIFFISIQNSDKKSIIKLLSFESARMPVGMVLALSFFSGKAIGNTLIILNSDYRTEIK
tara:strand:+ start:267 stop:500 length:234 start_codon:yes stop_codon:yes gene_type:complete